MAKLFSIPVSRISFLWMASCLLGGFALGSKVHNPLKVTTIHFEQVAWMAQQEPLQLAKIDRDEFKEKQLNISVDFKPFELSVKRQVHLQLSKKTPHPRLNSWLQLDRAIQNLKLSSREKIQKRIRLEHETLLIDYSSALRELHHDFTYALVPTVKSDEVRTIVSSAEPGVPAPEAVAEVLEVKYPPKKEKARAVAEPAEDNAEPGKLDIQLVNIHQNHNNPEPLSNIGISERAKASPYQRIIAEARSLASRPQRPKKLPQVESQASKTPVQMRSEAQLFTGQSKTAEPSDAEIQHLVETHALTGREATAKIPDESAKTPIAQTEQNKPEFTTYFNPTLSNEDQKVLTEAMLNEQVKALNAVTVSAKPVIGKIAATNSSKKEPATPATVQKTNAGFASKQANPDEDETIPEAYEPNTTPAPSPSEEPGIECAQLKKTRFINTLGNQICPTGVTWISRNWAGSGWVKVQNEHSPTLLTYYPSPNTGTAMSIDTNSISLLGITSGAKVMRGMGVILGLVPEGYEVDFVGRSEDPEYFIVQGKRYFAIINAEPGAGVVQVTSKKDQELSATVFAPVMEDTVTYLDLAAPKNADFTVRVVKNGGVDPEVVGLTVGVSTGAKIQAITQSQGRAFLRKVPTVPGYPVYIDVSSKIKEDQGYTYRYLLKNRNRLGEYVVNQVPEKSLFGWIRQVKQGLSDQSAMIVGFFNRKRLGGFKEHYFARAIPQTARFGLEPRNFSILWNGEISASEPLEGDVPRFMSVQVPEGLTQLLVTKESGEPAIAELIPISPRVIHVVSQ